MSRNIGSDPLPGGLEPLRDHLREYECINKGYVYFLLNKNELVYVGQSVSLPNRIQSHLKSNKRFDRVLFLREDLKRLDSVESALIHHFHPKYNARPGASTPLKFEILKNMGLTLCDSDEKAHQRLAKFLADCCVRHGD